MKFGNLDNAILVGEEEKEKRERVSVRAAKVGLTCTYD
jgi:hypothetical protein